MPPLRVLILVPVFNDWRSAAQLCGRLNEVLDAPDVRLKPDATYPGATYSILLVDDGSTDTRPADFGQAARAGLAVSVLELTRNVGHQRAIAIGLAYAHEHLKPDAVLVMDADGEDRPEDVPRLIEALQAGSLERAVFAGRRKRLESPMFRLGYMLYRLAHRALTGRGVEVGNFSVVPARYLDGLVASPELWSHYAATVAHIGIPSTIVPTDRGQRYSGKSHMNYISLIAHGLAALSVYRERVGTRLLIGACALCALLGAALVALMATTATVSVRRAIIAGIVVLLIWQVAAAAFAFAFGILANRQEMGFLPIRDYRHFVRARILLTNV